VKRKGERSSKVAGAQNPPHTRAVFCGFSTHTSNAVRISYSARTSATALSPRALLPVVGICAKTPRRQRQTRQWRTWRWRRWLRTTTHNYHNNKNLLFKNLRLRQRHPPPPLTTITTTPRCPPPPPHQRMVTIPVFGALTNPVDPDSFVEVQGTRVPDDAQRYPPGGAPESPPPPPAFVSAEEGAEDAEEEREMFDDARSDSCAQSWHTACTGREEQSSQALLEEEAEKEETEEAEEEADPSSP
jgi:hypothetical protein